MPNKALSGVEERSEYKSTRPCQYRRRLRQYPTELLAHPPPFRRDGRETFLAAMKIKFNCDAASPLGLAPLALLAPMLACPPAVQLPPLRDGTGAAMRDTQEVERGKNGERDRARNRFIIDGC